LLEAVMQELQAGRSPKAVQRELVLQKWTSAAAQRFVEIARRLANSQRHSPEKRGELAHRGWEQLQYALVWMGIGLVGANFTYAFQGTGVPFYICVFLLVWGSVDLFSGLTLWLPHRQFYDAYKPEPPKK